ncbi:hypothetical protein IAU59_007256 [Kwoniella sp. CBS 9459]
MSSSAQHLSPSRIGEDDEIENDEIIALKRGYLRKELIRQEEQLSAAREEGRFSLTEEQQRLLTPGQRSLILSAAGYNVDHKNPNKSISGWGASDAKSYVNSLPVIAARIHTSNFDCEQSGYPTPKIAREITLHCTRVARKRLNQDCPLVEEDGAELPDEQLWDARAVATETAGSFLTKRAVRHALETSGAALAQRAEAQSSQTGKPGSKSGKGKGKGAGWSTIGPELDFGRKAISAAIGPGDDDSKLEDLTEATTALLQVPVPDPEEYQEWAGRDGGRAMLKTPWPVHEVLTSLNQDTAVKAMSDSSELTSKMTEDVQRESLRRLIVDPENPVGSSEFVYTEPEGPALVTRNLTQLSKAIQNEYSADDPRSRYLVKRLMANGANFMRAYNSAHEKSLAAVQDLLSLDKTASLQSYKDTFTVNRRRKDMPKYSFMAIPQIQRTLDTLENKPTQYKELYETIFNPVVDAVNTEYQSRRKASAGADPDLSETNLLALQAQTDLSACREVYENTRDSLLPPESRGLTTSFGIHTPSLQPRTLLRALEEVKNLTSGTHYTPNLQSEAPNSASLAMSQLLRLRNDLVKFETDYIAELKQTHSAQTDVSSVTGMSTLEAERAYVYNPKQPASKVAARRKKYERVSEIRELGDKLSTACQVVLEEVDRAGIRLQSRSTRYLPEKAISTALTKQTALDSLVLGQQFNKVFDQSLALSKKAYDTEKKKIKSEVMEAAAKLKGTVYEGANTLLDFSRIHDSLPDGSIPDSDYLTSEPEESIAALSLGGTDDPQTDATSTSPASTAREEGDLLSRLNASLAPMAEKWADEMELQEASMQ